MPESQARPNVLVFVPHDLGDHLGCYGHGTVSSPNIDGIAGFGVRFDNYFTAAPECTPSRAGMMTGQYTHQNGLMGLCHRGWELAPEVSHLASLLGAGGYQTHLFGFQHETGGSPDRLGYQYHHSRENPRIGPVCDEVCAFLKSDGSPDNEPWFACVGSSHVHRPWGEQSSFAADQIEVPPYLPDLPEIRSDLARFHQSIVEMDKAVGTVMETLRQSGEAENTIVIFTTDHGSPFPGAKSTYYDPGIRIPLIMSWPGRVFGGLVYDQLLSNIDFAPTILEICGCPPPSGISGRSFAGLLLDGDFTEREEICGALYYDAFYDPMHCVRTKSHKYIRSFAVTEQDARGADPEVLAAHVAGTWIRADDSDVLSSPSWQAIASIDDGEGRSKAKPPREELYDLVADPREERNLADDPAKASVLQDMRERLQRMMVSSRSPLLQGHVSPDLSKTRNMRVSEFLAGGGRL